MHTTTAVVNNFTYEGRGCVQYLFFCVCSPAPLFSLFDAPFCTPVGPFERFLHKLALNTCFLAAPRILYMHIHRYFCSHAATPLLSVIFPLKVALFLEALLSRCASDVLAGSDEEESSPLKLLSDASFYEMEAVAQSGELFSRLPHQLQDRFAVYFVFGHDMTFSSHHSFGQLTMIVNCHRRVIYTFSVCSSS